MMASGNGSVRRRFEMDGAVPALGIEGARLLLAGVAPKDVAASTGMSVRTAYRWRKDLRAIELVEVDGWTATFARFRYRAPVRISAWSRVASRARAWDNGADEYSVPIAHNAQRPSARLYSGSEGVDIPEYRRNE
jgi:hypothetical protein